MPRSAAKPLTDAGVRAAKPGPRPIDIRDGDEPGLILTVLPSGRKQFTLRYRHSGKQRRLVLGDFPALTLSRARDKAAREKISVKDGRDPVVERRTARAPREDTIQALADEYLTRHARPHKKTAAADERALEHDVLPAWRDRPVGSITRRDVRKLLDRIVDRDAGVQANRTLALVRRMLNFAVDHDWIDSNPAARFARPTKESSRDRVLTDDEIRQLWRLLTRPTARHEKPAPGRRSARVADGDDPVCPVSATVAALWQFQLATACRGGEAQHLQWGDLDLKAKLWLLPASKAKTSTARVIALNTVALAVVKAQPRGQADGYVFAASSGGPAVVAAKRATRQIKRALGFDVRAHDLRRTAATKMAELGVSHEHVARALGHAPGGPAATRVYDRHAYVPEMRAALATWGRALQRLVRKCSR